MKIHCVFHKEDTPSLVLYETRYKCFGCGKSGKLSELPEDARQGVVERPKREVEDIKTSLAKILDLPRKIIRGLRLPYDSTGYYIVYPFIDYYTKRIFNPEKGSKYIGPSGVRKPLMKVTKNSTTKLVLIEGQINALSLAKVLMDSKFTIASPGSCTDLLNREFIDEYLKYSNIFVIVDKDVPGVKAGLSLKEQLASKGKSVSLHAMPKDFNEILVEYGDNGVKKEANKILGLSG